MFRRHHIIGPAIGLACDKRHLWHSGLGIGEQQFGTVADNAACFLCQTGHEAGDIDKRNQRDVECITKADKTCCLARRIDIEASGENHRLVTHHANGFPVDTAKADNDVIEAAITLLKKVGLSNRAYSPAGIISHGEHRQLEIAMALASKPKLLLLDEPMAGMGLEEAKKITKLLKNISKKLTIILIEHDMDTVFTLANRLIVLVSGKVIADGPPEKIRKLDHVRKAYLGEEEDF